MFLGDLLLTRFNCFLKKKIIRVHREIIFSVSYWQSNKSLCVSGIHNMISTSANSRLRKSSGCIAKVNYSLRKRASFNKSQLRKPEDLLRHCSVGNFKQNLHFIWDNFRNYWFSKRLGKSKDLEKCSLFLLKAESQIWKKRKKELNFAWKTITNK